MNLPDYKGDNLFIIPRMLIDPRGGTRDRFIECIEIDQGVRKWSFMADHVNQFDIIKYHTGDVQITMNLTLGTYDLIYGSDNNLLTVSFNPRDIMSRLISSERRQHYSPWMDIIATRISESTFIKIDAFPFEKELIVHDDVAINADEPVELIPENNCDSVVFTDKQTDIDISYEQTDDYVTIGVSYQTEAIFEPTFRRVIHPLTDFFTHPTVKYAMKHLSEVIINTR